MGYNKPSLPTGKLASIAHMERLREQNERRRRAVEKREIDEAMRRQALARDPANAGINMGAIEHQAVKVKFDATTGKVKLAKRESENVFDLITMDDHLAEAGHRITQIWADRMGMGGSAPKPSEADDIDYDPKPSQDSGYVDKSRVDVELMNCRMDYHSRLWKRIMTPTDGFGRMSVYPMLFDALCEDIVTGQRWRAAEGIRKPVSQWRHIVQKLTGEKQPHRQAGVIQSACAELYLILKEIDKARYQ